MVKVDVSVSGKTSIADGGDMVVVVRMKGGRRGKKRNGEQGLFRSHNLSSIISMCQQERGRTIS